MAIVAALLAAGLWASRMLDLRRSHQAHAAQWRRDAKTCRALAGIEAARGDAALAGDYRRWAEGSDRMAVKWGDAASRPWIAVEPDPSNHPR